MQIMQEGWHAAGLPSPERELTKRISVIREFGRNQVTQLVDISKEEKGLELLKCVIREACGEHGAAKEGLELVSLLERLVQEKKFLLVLDDVWEESLAVWEESALVDLFVHFHCSDTVSLHSF